MQLRNLDEFIGADLSEKMGNALKDTALHPGTVIHIDPGVYPLTSPRARQTMADAISGRYGENPEDTMFSPDYAFSVGFSMAGQRGTVIDAYGVTLLVDGFMEPISIDHCEDVEIRGLTIDHKRKPFSCGVIERYEILDREQRTGEIDVRFFPEYPVDENTIMPRYCAYDFRTHRFDLDMKTVSRAFLGDQLFRFQMKNMPERELLHQEFYVWHSFHYRPAILIEEAKNVRLTDVTIHSQPGMGIVGHRSENITMERLRVVPSHGTHMSTNTDATHFTSCKGDIVFRGCVFSGHGDDATNVHTFYHDILPLGGCVYQGSVPVKTHSLTLDHPDVGDEMELVEKDSLAPKDRFRVLSVTPDAEKQIYTARLDHPLPEGAQEKYYLANVTRAPQLTFSGCTADNHWARSVLIKTRNATVEGCTFTGSVLQAIHVAAEGWWHEGVACENIVIRNNRFCCCGIGGHAEVGGVKVEMSVDRPDGTPQKHIVIENNIFHLPNVRCAVHVSNAEDVILRDNRFSGCAEPYGIRDCKDVTVQ